MDAVLVRTSTHDPKYHYKMRALRRALDVSQEELGELIGVSSTLISMYERGIVEGKSINDEVNLSLSMVRERLVDKYGYWYDAYIELKCATNLLDTWVKLEGHAPLDVIRRAKECACAFMNI